MSEPAPTTGRGDARIVARGFARYDGPRSGVPGAIRSVAWQSIRATLGIGRLARHKIFPIISVAIALFIAYGAWHVVDESVTILMEGTPSDLDVAQLVADMQAIEGIREVHDLHVWSIARNMPSLSCHVLIEDEQIPHSVRIVAAATKVLGEKYGIHHTTIQAEAEHCSPDSPACNMGFVQPAPHGHTH